MSTMRRRLASLAAAGLIALAVIPPAIAGADETVRDEFGSIAFAGNDGSIPWTDEWREIPIGDGPTAGQIRVVGDGHCAAGNCLRIGDQTLAAGVYREANLTGFASAVLTYSYRRQMTDDGNGGIVKLRVSPDLWTWTDAASHLMDVSDSGQVTQIVDLSGWAGGPVKIAFFGVGQLDGYVFVDNVQILMSTNASPAFDAPLPNLTSSEGDAISISPEASDPDGDDLSFAATGLPPGVSIAVGSGVISGTVAYSAASGSPYSTLVTVSDGGGRFDTEQFTWTVTDVNRPPKLAPIADRSVAEAELMKVVASASDPDMPGDVLHFILTEAPAGATVDSNGKIKWTPTETTGPGSYGFELEVTDSGIPARSDVASFEVTVAEVNTAPSLAFIPDQANGQGDAVYLSVSATDRDVPANTLTFAAAGLPAGVSIDPSSGLVSGTISAAAPQSNSTATITVTDNGAPPLSTSRSFSWQITQGNEAPVLLPIPDQQPDIAGKVAFTARATDGDGGDILNFWLADGIDPVPAGATVNSANGSFTWMPSDDQYGATYRINVGVSDSGSPRLSDTQLVQITIPRLNVAPTVTSPGNQQSDEGEVVALQIAAADPDNDPLRFSATGLPDGLLIDSGSGLISGEVGFDAAAESPFDVTVQATDGGSPAKVGTVSFQWSVAETNRPPIASEVTVLAMVGQLTPITLDVVDPDGDELNYTLNSAPVTGRLEGDPPNLIFTTPGGADMDSFSFTVSDGEFETIASVAIEVRAGNAPPNADTDEYEVETGELLRIEAPGVLANDSDIDGEPLQAALVSAPAHGDLVLNQDGSFTYMPDEGFSSGDKFVYAAVDGLGEQATATVVIDVIAPPVVVPPPIDDSSRSVVLAASGSLWEPALVENPPLPTELRRAVVAAANAGISTLPALKFPLLLLAIALLLGLTVGRVSMLPLGVGKREELGMVVSYDAVHQLGRVTAEGSTEEVFVHGNAMDRFHQVLEGQQVRFVATTIEGRRIALKVWPAGS